MISKSPLLDEGTKSYRPRPCGSPITFRRPGLGPALESAQEAGWLGPGSQPWKSGPEPTKIEGP